jgi:threonine/homoserine/homoserine lactone efflux protein
MLDTFLLLVLSVLIATISPGGATTLATASGATFGWWRSFPLLSGISFGLASMVVVAAFGLGGVILAVPVLQLAMKLLGSLYLFWLAVQIALRGQPGKAAVTQNPPRFIAGVGLLWQNPRPGR